MLGERIWEISKRPRELASFIAAQTADKKPALRYVQAYFSQPREKAPVDKLCKRQMHEKLPQEFQVYNATAQQYVLLLKKAYYLNQQPLDQSVLDFLFDTNQLEVVLSAEFCAWTRLSDYNIADLIAKHYFRGDLGELMRRARTLNRLAPRLEAAFGKSPFESLREMHDEKRAISYCYQLFASFEALSHNSHPFACVIAEFAAMSLFLQGNSGFLLYAKPRDLRTLDAASSTPEINFAHVLAWLFDCVPQKPFRGVSASFDAFVKRDFEFLQGGQIDLLQKYIAEAIFPAQVTQHIDRLLIYAFSRCNGQNLSLYMRALTEIHQTCFLHAAKFYATKVLLTDLGDMIFAILRDSVRVSPLLARCFVIVSLQQLDYDCFAKGRIQKSMQNAVVFLVKVCHELGFMDLLQHVARIFERFVVRYEILAVFGLREVIFRLFGQTQRKSVDSVQSSMDLALMYQDTTPFDVIQLESPARAILALNHANFGRYYKQANCLVDELSDMITLLRNDLLFIYNGKQFQLDFEPDANNILTPLILPNYWDARSAFDRGLVLNFGQIFGITQYYPSTVLDSGNVRLISAFVYQSPRHFHDKIAQFIEYHLEKGRRREVAEIVGKIIMNSLTWTKNDADRVGDFFMLLFQQIEQEEMRNIVFQILTFYTIKYTASLNAVQALYLALKFQDIKQFQQYFTIIKHIVAELYSDTDDTDSVFLRYIIQQFAKSQIEVKWDCKAVECYILEPSQIEEEFSKWLV